MRNAPRLALCATFATLACSASPATATPPILSHHMSASLPFGVQVEVLGEDSDPLPGALQRGRRYVLGAAGERYSIRISNPSSRRLEAVVSVDGLDVIDGKPANLSKRGYILSPYGEVHIEGWRTSLGSVAAFRFGSVSDSYAARTSGARNVGVIGVALFTEQRPRTVYIVPRPYDDGRDHDHHARRESSPPSAPAGRGAATPPAKSSRSAEPAPSAEAGAPRHRAQLDRVERDRPGLGTEFGEHRDSHVQMVSFVRESSRPVGTTELRYNNHQGLARLGIIFQPHWDDDDTLVRETANPFPGEGRRFANPPPARD